MKNLKATVLEKLESECIYYSERNLSLFDKLFGEEFISFTEVSSELNEILENKSRSLSIENIISLTLLFSIKKGLDQLDYMVVENKDYITKCHENLNFLLKKSMISNRDVILSFKELYPLISLLFGKDLIKSIYTPEIIKINKHLTLLKREKVTKYSFINTVNYTKLGDFFKCLNLQILSEFKDIVSIGRQNLRAIKEHKTNSASPLHAPGLSNAIEKLTNEYLDEVKMDNLDFTELEYIELTDYSLSLFPINSTLEQNTDLLKECFTFKKTSVLGLSKMLYPLFNIASDTNDFPQKEEWVRANQNKGLMDNDKAWNTHVIQKVRKYINTKDIFAQ